MNNNTTKKTYYIYKLINSVTDKIYVGQTGDPKDRFYAKNYRGKKIADAIAEIGWENFTPIMIAKTTSKEKANKLERFYIEKFDSVNNGYNSTYKTTERLSVKKSAERNAKARATMSATKWYFNPSTNETTRIIDGEEVPDGFVRGRGGKIEKVKGHFLWEKTKVA